MNNPPPNSPAPGGPPLTLLAGLFCSLGAVACFHVAYSLTAWGWAMVGFPLLLLPLVRLRHARAAFYFGLAIGFAVYAPQLGFFWGIFGPAALLLWGILAFWVGLFLTFGQALNARLNPTMMVFVLPVLWTGLEFFRCELYYLRFAWLTPGAALSPSLPSAATANLGIYGLSAVSFLGAAVVHGLRGKLRRTGLMAVAILLAFASVNWTTPRAPRSLRVGGAQTGSLAETDLPAVLNRMLAAHPDTELLVLPEYTLLDGPDESLRAWCRQNRRHLIVGGRDACPDGSFYNTAFVIDATGEIVFRQVKSVPIQFFTDGKPAPSQALWNSPWGRIGIAICYDLSYSRVIDALIQQGAELLVIPTMDAASWGEYQHRLHARMAPLRAAEYQVPIVRVASSGISQWVDRAGAVVASAPCSEDLHWVVAQVEIRGAGRRPWDRWWGPICTAVTGLLIAWLALPRTLRSRLSLARPESRIS